MNSITYSATTAEDLPAVVELCMLVEAQHEAYWPLRWERRPGLEEGYLRWLGKRVGDPRMLIEVARDGTQVVGMILVTIQDEIPIYTFKEFALIQDMAVRTTHQRRGISQKLLEIAAEWTRSHGLTQLRLMVAHQNPGARKAFEKAGFLPTYQEMVLPTAPDS